MLLQSLFFLLLYFVPCTLLPSLALALFLFLTDDDDDDFLYSMLINDVFALMCEFEFIQLFSFDCAIEQNGPNC